MTKKEVVSQDVFFYEEYARKYTLVPRDTPGSEIHIAHGLFNQVAQTYGLEEIEDRMIPRAYVKVKTQYLKHLLTLTLIFDILFGRS